MLLVRILLDENVPRRLAHHFPSDHAVTTVQMQGWTGKKNGELLRLAETDFDILITMDQGVEYQQNLTGFQLAVMVLRAASNRLADLLPLMPEVLDATQTATPGQIRQVPAL